MSYFSRPYSSHLESLFYPWTEEIPEPSDLSTQGGGPSLLNYVPGNHDLEFSVQIDINMTQDLCGFPSWVWPQWVNCAISVCIPWIKRWVRGICFHRVRTEVLHLVWCPHTGMSHLLLNTAIGGPLPLPYNIPLSGEWHPIICTGFSHPQGEGIIQACAAGVEGWNLGAILELCLLHAPALFFQNCVGYLKSSTFSFKF